MTRSSWAILSPGSLFGGRQVRTIAAYACEFDGFPLGSKAGTGRRGRPKGSGTRAIQALELVKARPGITIPELAEAMGIKQNYLYRVMPGLADDGKVTKSGRGWHAREAA